MERAGTSVRREEDVGRVSGGRVGNMREGVKGV